MIERVSWLGMRFPKCSVRTHARSRRHDAMQDTSTLDIDLTAIDHNMSVLRRAVGNGCALCPIVKADAYGLGVGRVAKRLVGAGAEMLAVYSLRQAIETAAAMNGAVPILVLMPVVDIPREDELVRLMLAGQLHLVVHDEANLAALEACAESIGVTLPVHLEIDVGMSRGGANPSEASRIIRAVHESRRLLLRGVFAHFSHSRYDAARTEDQLARYSLVVEANRRFIPTNTYEHVASTYALARDERYHRTMVRFGLAWLGYGIDELEANAPLITRDALRPVVRWSSTVVSAKVIAANCSVGYGARWTASRRSTIGLIPVGYADGFPVARLPAACGQQMIGVRTPRGTQAYAPVIGAINMDQITVDLTDLYDSSANDWIGCEAEIVGRNVDAPNHLPRLAAQSGLIVHELLTRLNPRLTRVVSSDSLPTIAGSVAPTRSVDDATRANSAAG